MLYEVITEHGDVEVGLRGLLLCKEQGQAFHAAGKAHAGRVRAAQGLDQAVVAAAPGHGGLGADVAGDDLEGGALVVSYNFV